MMTRTGCLVCGLVALCLGFLAFPHGVTQHDAHALAIVGGKAAIVAYLGIWLVALVSLLRRRDIDIHDKLTWVVTILLLNGIGGLLYFLFGPEGERKQEDAVPPVPPDAEPYDGDGVSWNPILGENRLLPGRGLNPLPDKGRPNKPGDKPTDETPTSQ